MWEVFALNEFLAQLTKQPISSINVLLALIFTIPLGIIYRKVLHPKRVPHSIRHLVGLILGLWLGWVCIKRDIFVLIAICLLCYLLNYIIHPRSMHKVVFGVSMGFLLLAQIVRMTQSYGENDFDYVGPLMLQVQKLTYVAFSLHDGASRNEKDLNEWEKRQSIKTFPSLLEYFGYLFHFSGFLVGPTYTFCEYMDFIQGKDIERALEDSKEHHKEPSPLICLLRKSLSVPITIGVCALLGPIFPLNRNGDPLFVAKTPFISRLFYAWASLEVRKMTYYTGFVLGEMGVISCGMGFTGYDKNGNEMWENAKSVNILSVEFPSSLKMVFDNWNIATAKWLRRIVNDRVPNQKAALTFTVSLLWHGIYPGYFLTAISSFLFLQASREVRRAYGQVYQDISPLLHKSLHALQIFVNILLLMFCVIPFQMLRFDLGLVFFRSMYYYCFIICGLSLLLLRMRKTFHPRLKHYADSKQKHLKNSHIAIDNNANDSRQS